MAEEQEIQDIHRYEHEWPESVEWSSLEHHFRRHPEYEFIGTHSEWKLCGGCGRAARIPRTANRFCLDCMEKEFEECELHKRPLPLHWFKEGDQKDEDSDDESDTEENKDEGKDDEEAKKPKLLGHRPNAIYALRSITFGEIPCHPKWNAKVLRGRDWEIPANRIVGTYEHNGLRIPGTIIRSTPMLAVVHPKFYERRTEERISQFFNQMIQDSSALFHRDNIPATREIVMLGWRI